MSGCQGDNVDTLTELFTRADRRTFLPGRIAELFYPGGDTISELFTRADRRTFLPGRIAKLFYPGGDTISELFGSAELTVKPEKFRVTVKLPRQGSVVRNPARLSRRGSVVQNQAFVLLSLAG